MAVKKTELYSHLWEAANALRGGMDASQYKDYVLTILFIKYVTDKYKDDPFNEDGFVVPEGGSFDDLVAAKGKKDIGEKINIALSKLAEENGLKGVIDIVDFDDDTKLGSGKEKVDKLTKLIGIFENPQLNFSKNRADGDDILGDVYEYFMKKFATEAGKSKGQFYTPAEVSRVMAKIIEVEKAASPEQTAYDPTCGSGSLLLKVASEAKVKISLYGQEKDINVANIARMNMILHARPDAEIAQGNTLSHPKFLNKDGSLKRFDYAVANPPFSQKNWMNGVDVVNDPYHRFDDGVPPAKNGDYAFLLHFIKSLKSTGKGTIILPHGVLFRGNAEAEIRKNLVQKGYIKGIIGLPTNLFFGTGIPAVILVIDKENASARKGIFIIDASKEFRKDGNKNRLRERDIHKIVDTFVNFKEIDGYSKMVGLDEIKKNEYNLNIPRYIQSLEEEDIQDIYAHLHGGIPKADIEKIAMLNLFKNVKEKLFDGNDYYSLTIDIERLYEFFEDFDEVKEFKTKALKQFEQWAKKNLLALENINSNTHPKELIQNLSESLLRAFKPLDLIDEYAIYQILMDYWDEVMKDDVYMIIENGWEATPKIEFDKKGKIKSWDSDLLPKEIVMKKLFKEDKEVLEKLEAKKDEINAKLEELKEENSGEEGILEEVKNDKGNITKDNLKKKTKELKNLPDFNEEIKVLKQYLELLDKENEIKKQIKEKEANLDTKLLERYKAFSKQEVKDLVINKKWLLSLQTLIEDEIENLIMQTVNRIKELHKRYATPLPEIEKEVDEYEQKVKKHLKVMGFSL